LDIAKYAVFLACLPDLVVPILLSDGGYCSPQSIFTINGRRGSLPSGNAFE